MSQKTTFEGRILRKDHGIKPEFTPYCGFEVIQEGILNNVKLNNCALRNVEFGEHDKGVEGRRGVTLLNCMLSNVSLVGDCEITNFSWDGGRPYMAFTNAYINGWENVNTYPAPDGKDWAIITYPDLDSYKKIYDEEGWYQARTTSKRRISVSVPHTNWRTGEEWYDLYCYSKEGLKAHSERRRDPDDFERVLYEHLKSLDVL